LLFAFAARAQIPHRLIGESGKTLRRVCQRLPGHTIMRHGVARVFSHAGDIYGCVNGSQRAVWLWKIQAETRGSVTQVAGRFVAVDWMRDDQYEYDRAVVVVDLRTGSSYSIAEVTEPISGVPEGSPPTPGPWPLETFALGSDGRAARLYDIYGANSGSIYGATPVGQVLDLVGFHHYRRRLATGGPGAIVPGSLAYRDHTVTWQQDGSSRTTSV
jgi:hypothetical protein